jgi:hypothetical protein
MRLEDDLRLSIRMGLTKGLRLVRGLRRLLDEEDRNSWRRRYERTRSLPGGALCLDQCAELPAGVDGHLSFCSCLMSERDRIRIQEAPIQSISWHS